MTEITNKERAERARKVLETYEHLGGTRADEVDTAAQDLVTDLLHLLRRDCGLIAIDRKELLNRAVQMNLEEINKDPEGHTMNRKTKLQPLRDIPSYAVIIRAIHERGATQNEALAELARRGLWLTSEQRLQAEIAP